MLGFKATARATTFTASAKGKVARPSTAAWNLQVSCRDPNGSALPVPLPEALRKTRRSGLRATQCLMSVLTDSIGRKNRKGLTIDIRGDSEVLQVTEPCRNLFFGLVFDVEDSCLYIYTCVHPRTFDSISGMNCSHYPLPDEALGRRCTHVYICQQVMSVSHPPKWDQKFTGACR